VTEGRLAGDLVGTPDRLHAGGETDGWRALRDGIIVGVTNPKTYILFGAILPQFINRSAGDVPLQMLLLAGISVCMGLVSDCAWGLGASAVRTWFAARRAGMSSPAAPAAWR
jgi:threonine/homoserine/homoserine lactone efflux protein